MFCQCGNPIQVQERFCSKCGKETSAVRHPMAHPVAMRDWDTHVKILAWIFIISALVMAILGLCLLLFPGLIMMGFTFPRFLLAGPFFVVMALVFIAVPAGIAAAGIGLLKYREWARVVTLILSAFMLIGFPFGTVIGIYAFWVLLSTEGSSSYKRGPSADRRWDGQRADVTGVG